jgi:transcriptional regulator with XRE-family HTH domain
MTGPITAAITAEITSRRQAQGLTRDEVSAAARAAGAPDTLTRAALRNIEIGRRSVAVDELVWLAAALNTPVWDLLGEHAALFGQVEAKPSDPDVGAVTDAVHRAVEQLGDDDLVDQAPVLVETALALARQLDDGAGMAAAAISKELRATLDAIWAGAVNDDDDEDNLGPA